MYTTSVAAMYAMVSPQTFTRRAQHMGLIPVLREGNPPAYLWTNEQIERVRGEY